MTAEQHPLFLTLEDFWSLKLVSEATISPDGKLVAYVVGSYDEQHDKLHSAIWLAPLKGGQARQLTSGEATDSQPAWSPDSKRLAFVSTRHEDKPQIFLMNVDGGEARRLTSTPDGATGPLWSPDSTRLCYCSSPETEQQKVPQEVEWLKGHSEVDKNAPRLRRQRTLMARFDARGYLDRRSHLFLINPDDPKAEPRQLTTGDYDAGQPAWSPDGALIAFSSTRTENSDLSFASDIWTVDVASGALTCLTDGTLTAILPAWSPDGQIIAFYAEPDWTTHNGRYHNIDLWAVSRAGGDQRNLSASLDRGFGGLQPDYVSVGFTPLAWAPDGHTIYFRALDRGDCAIFAVANHGGTARRVSKGTGNIASFRLTGDGKTLVGIAATPTQPNEVYAVPASGGALRWVTQTNRALLDQVKLAAPESIPFKGAKGWKVEGWLYKPVTTEGARPYPLLLNIHGGPHGAWGNTFYFQAQVLAGAGYASLYLNPRGSSGYGQRFADAADWGADDYRDLMAGVDAVLAKGEVDPKRLGVTGISYGGFMTNWIVGHTDRFAAAVSVNGVSNLVSFDGTSDIAGVWFTARYGPFWATEQTWRFYREHSPITYVGQVATPLLLLQAEDDYRCPIEQGEQMLSALRLRRQVVELIRFPKASHAIVNTAAPHHRYFQWKLALDWFDAYVKGQPAQPAPEPEAVGVAVELALSGQE